MKGGTTMKWISDLIRMSSIQQLDKVGVIRKGEEFVAFLPSDMYPVLMAVFYAEEEAARIVRDCVQDPRWDERFRPQAELLRKQAQILKDILSMEFWTSFGNEFLAEGVNEDQLLSVIHHH